MDKLENIYESGTGKLKLLQKFYTSFIARKFPFWSHAVAHVLLLLLIHSVISICVYFLYILHDFFDFRISVVSYIAVVLIVATDSVINV